MITQSQYFYIEEYLEKEVRLIESELIEELIDHFMDSISLIMEEGTSFKESFEIAKVDFGGKAGLRKIQRAYQVNTLKNYRAGIQAEFLSYFQWPYLWRTGLFAALATCVVFYFNLRLPSWTQSDFWAGMIDGGLIGAVFILFIFTLSNKLELGIFRPQARHWFSALCSLSLVALMVLAAALLYVFPYPLFSQLITLMLIISGGLAYLAIFRFSRRTLYVDEY